MDLKEIEKVVAKVQGTIFKKSNSRAAGTLKSHFRGVGLQFKEHQVYTHGDDVRFIDWKMLAKTSTPYIKTFEEERNVEISVVIDATPTMFMGQGSISKLQAAIELTCLLYLLAKKSGDFIHLIFFYGKVEILPKKNGHEGIILFFSLLKKLKLMSSEGRIIRTPYALKNLDNQARLQWINREVYKRREVVLFSDYNDYQLESLDSDAKKIFQHKLVHNYRIICPLDEATKIPYALGIKNYETGDGNNSKRCFGKVLFSKMNDIETLGHNFKTLRVEKPYLDEFIRDMR